MCRNASVGGHRDVLVSVPAPKGFVGLPPMVRQAHMDMVGRTTIPPMISTRPRHPRARLLAIICAASCP